MRTAAASKLGQNALICVQFDNIASDEDEDELDINEDNQED